MVIERSASLAFKPSARLLGFLGDELIRDPNIVIFKLVKNAYDADASYATVTMLQVDDRSSSMIFVDDGTGVKGVNVQRLLSASGTTLDRLL